MGKPHLVTPGTPRGQDGPKEGEHHVALYDLANNVRLDTNATIIEMLGAAEVLRHYALGMLTGASVAAQVEAAQAEGLLRGLGNLRAD